MYATVLVENVNTNPVKAPMLATPVNLHTPAMPGGIVKQLALLVNTEAGVVSNSTVSQVNKVTAPLGTLVDSEL